MIPATIEMPEDITIPGGKRNAKANIKRFGSVDRAWRYIYKGSIARDRFRVAARSL